MGNKKGKLLGLKNSHSNHYKKPYVKIETVIINYNLDKHFFILAIVYIFKKDSMQENTLESKPVLFK